MPIPLFDVNMKNVETNSLGSNNYRNINLSNLNKLKLRATPIDSNQTTSRAWIIFSGGSVIYLLGSSYDIYDNYEITYFNAIYVVQN